MTPSKRLPILRVYLPACYQCGESGTGKLILRRSLLQGTELRIRYYRCRSCGCCFAVHAIPAAAEDFETEYVDPSSF